MPLPTIEQPKQLIVEGNDEVRVFNALCRHLGISGVQVQQCGGYPNLRTFLRTFTADPDFHEVQSLAVVADANTNRSGRQQSIENTLSNVGLPAPSAPLQIASQGGIQVAYLVVPHDCGRHDAGGCLLGFGQRGFRDEVRGRIL